MPVTTETEGGLKGLTSKELEEFARREKTPKTNGEKKRKSPVPQQYERILAGALKLNITQRAALITALTDANKAELEQKEKEYVEAKNLVEGG